MRLLDPAWIGTLASIIAILLTTIFYFKTKQKKSLSYEILSEHPLVSIHDEIKERLQILIDGVQTENVHLILLKLTNDGTVPISAADFERPISLKFSGDSSILSAEPINASPSNLTPGTSVDKSIVSIKPVLMNPGDSFTMKLLLSQYKGSFNVDARILGIRELRITRKQDRTRRAISVGIASAVVSVFLIVFVGDSVIRIFTDPPVIIKLEANKDKVHVKEDFILNISATGKELEIEWPIILNGTGPKHDIRSLTQIYSTSPPQGSAYIVAPSTPGQAIIEVSVRDRWGRRDKKSISIDIIGAEQKASSPAPTP